MNLIQRHLRGGIKSVNKTLSEMYPLDTMYNSNFENGVFSKCIRELQAREDIIQEVIHVFDDKKQIKLNVFFSPSLVKQENLYHVVKSKIEPEVYVVSEIFKINDGDEDCEEYTHFYAKDNSKRLIFSLQDIVAWTDIEYGVFFTADDMDLNFFKSMIYNSVTRYNHMKAGNR